MVDDSRSLRYRKVLAVLLAALLSAGYLVFTGGGSSTVQSALPPAPVKELTLGDVVLAAASAQGITMRYDGVTTPASGDIPMTSFQFGFSRGVSGGAAT